MKEDLTLFVNKYLAMTNKELFDFIQDYGETQFFIELWSSLKIEGWKLWYADVAHAYYATRYYFETH